MASVNHFMAVTEELLNHILALLPILWPQNSKNKPPFRENLVKFADYYGKIRRIMLHKPKITGQSTHPTSETCNASSEGASDPDIGAYALESETTPDASVNHFMAVKLVILKQFVAVLETFAAKCRAKHSIVGLYSIQTTYCRNMAHKSYSPPKYAFTFGFISAI